MSWRPSFHELLHLWSPYTRLDHDAHSDASILPSLAHPTLNRIKLLLEMHQTPQSPQIGRVEGLSHQIREHQLGRNVLRRDNTALSEVAQILVLHKMCLDLMEEASLSIWPMAA